MDRPLIWNSSTVISGSARSLPRPWTRITASAMRDRGASGLIKGSPGTRLCTLPRAYYTRAHPPRPAHGGLPGPPAVPDRALHDDRLDPARVRIDRLHRARGRGRGSRGLLPPLGLPRLSPPVSYTH